MTMDDWSKRVDKLMRKLEGKGVADAFEKTELFLLHNEVVPSLWRPLEYGKSCGKCVARVYKRVKDYWEKNIKDTI